MSYDWAAGMRREAPSTHEGRCTECGRRRDVISASRLGGGNYRRPSRWYSTSVCLECAGSALDYADKQWKDPDKVWMLSVSDLRYRLNRPRPAQPVADDTPALDNLTSEPT